MSLSPSRSPFPVSSPAFVLPPLPLPLAASPSLSSVPPPPLPPSPSSGLVTGPPVNLAPPSTSPQSSPPVVTPPSTLSPAEPQPIPPSDPRPPNEGMPSTPPPSGEKPPSSTSPVESPPSDGGRPPSLPSPAKSPPTGGKMPPSPPSDKATPPLPPPNRKKSPSPPSNGTTSPSPPSNEAMPPSPAHPRPRRKDQPTTPPPTAAPRPLVQPPPMDSASTAPLPSSPAPRHHKLPDKSLPFFGPSGSLPDQPIGPLSPPRSNGRPDTSPGNLVSASSPQLLPLVPKSLSETKEPHGGSAGLVFGSVIGGVLLLVLLGLLFVCYRATRNRRHSFKADQAQNPPCLAQKESSIQRSQQNVAVISVPPELLTLSPLRSSTSTGLYNDSGHNYKFQTQSVGGFSYEELVEATNGFSEANLLGEGGFGYVHKGVLPNGKLVAVKQLKTGSRQGEREFQAEVDTISRVHHKHLVSLVGYCITGSRRLLVYEFVPNNTLEYHLHGNATRVLDWETRLGIAIGSAKGLAYLHEDCNPAIIHRDIKAANILLDSKFEAKVSDFGLAKIFSDTNTSITHISTRVVGTFGYMAPEYASSGKLTDKSDIYSFGVMLLELITGRPPITVKEPLAAESLVDWARPLLARASEENNFNELVDPKLENDYKTSQMASMVSCASSCVRHSAWLRPRMSQIVFALENDTPLARTQEATHGSSNSISECSNYCRQDQYREDMKRFRVLVDRQSTSEYFNSGSTSEYGLNPSVSSGEAQP